MNFRMVFYFELLKEKIAAFEDSQLEHCYSIDYKLKKFYRKMINLQIFVNKPQADKSFIINKAFLYYELN